jgi:hypothetical protein
MCKVWTLREDILIPCSYVVIYLRPREFLQLTFHVKMEVNCFDPSVTAPKLLTMHLWGLLKTTSHEK